MYSESTLNFKRPSRTRLGRHAHAARARLILGPEGLNDAALPQTAVAHKCLRNLYRARLRLPGLRIGGQRFGPPAALYA